MTVIKLGVFIVFFIWKWYAMLSNYSYVLLCISVIPLNLLTLDTIGRRYTLMLNFLLSAVFFLLVQICATKVVLTMFIFGVRTFSSGIFNAVYIYTTEVRYLLYILMTNISALNFINWICENGPKLLKYHNMIYALYFKLSHQSSRKMTTISHLIM